MPILVPLTLSFLRLALRLASLPSLEVVIVPETSSVYKVAAHLAFSVVVPTHVVAETRAFGLREFAGI